MVCGIYPHVYTHRRKATKKKKAIHNMILKCPFTCIICKISQHLFISATVLNYFGSLELLWQKSHFIYSSKIAFFFFQVYMCAANYYHFKYTPKCVLHGQLCMNHRLQRSYSWNLVFMQYSWDNYNSKGIRATYFMTFTLNYLPSY